VKRLAALACFAWATAGASTPTTWDFATGFELTTTGTGPMYEAVLPLEVHRASRTRDLGDMRIFNAAGEVVPHALTPLDPPAPREQRLVGVPFFAVPRSEAGPDELVLRFRRRADGRLELLDLPEARSDEPDRRFILDMSGVVEPVAALIFRWQRPRNGFLHVVSVSASDDMIAWQVIVERATLAHLRRDGRALRRDRIELSAAGYRYLRIDFGMDAPPPRITGVLAEPAARSGGAEIRWSPIASRTELGEPDRYLFELPRSLPVRRIQVKATERNTLTRATFYSRDEAELPWRRSGQMTVYNLEFGGGSVSNSSIPMIGGRHRYWVLEADRSGGGFGATEPVLSVGWQPRLVVFVARGEPPYTLAVGSERVKTPPVGAQEVLRFVDERAAARTGSLGLAVAQVGAAKELAGEAAFQPPRPPLDWKRWLLWLALAGGAGVMLWMAVSLLREGDEGRQA